MAIDEVVLRNCVWGVRCAAKWEDMEPTTFAGVRHCTACDKPVHHCEDEEQLVYAIAQNWCVAFETGLANSAEPQGSEAMPILRTTGLVAEVRPPTFAWMAKHNKAFLAPPADYDAKEWADQSPLHLLGYRAGRKGLSLNKRRQLLEAFFWAHLPTEFPKTYADRWGRPGSQERRAAMIEHIRWLAEQAGKRENAAAMDVAIADWTKDADFLEGVDW